MKLVKIIEKLTNFLTMNELLQFQAVTKVKI